MDCGEYRYINNIDVCLEEMLEIKCNCKKEYELNINKNDNKELKGTLIPIGGGKDSCVTLELLKETKDENLCIIIGGKFPSLEAARIAGYEEKIIYIQRTIDKNLLELNKK